MTTPRTKSRWSTGGAEDRHAEAQTIAAHREKATSASVHHVWLPSGPTTHNVPRRASGSLSGAIPPGSKPQRISSIKKRATTESVIEAAARRPLQLRLAEVPKQHQHQQHEHEQAAIFDALPAPVPQQQDRYTINTPAAPSTPVIDAALVDFWMVLQQTQQNLQDMLVDLDTAKLEVDLTNARAQQAEQHAERLEAAVKATSQGLAAQQQQLKDSQEREVVLRRRVFEVMQRNAELLHALQKAEQLAASTQAKLDRVLAARPSEDKAAAERESAELSKLTAEAAAAEAKATKAELELAVARTKLMVSEQEAAQREEGLAQLQLQLHKLHEQLGLASGQDEAAKGRASQLSQQQAEALQRLQQQQQQHRSSVAQLASAVNSLQDCFVVHSNTMFDQLSPGQTPQAMTPAAQTPQDLSPVHRQSTNSAFTLAPVAAGAMKGPAAAVPEAASASGSAAGAEAVAAGLGMTRGQDLCGLMPAFEYEEPCDPEAGEEAAAGQEAAAAAAADTQQNLQRFDVHALCSALASAADSTSAGRSHGSACPGFAEDADASCLDSSPPQQSPTLHTPQQRTFQRRQRPGGAGPGSESAAPGTQHRLVSKSSLVPLDKPPAGAAPSPGAAAGSPLHPAHRGPASHALGRMDSTGSGVPPVHDLQAHGLQLEPSDGSLAPDGSLGPSSHALSASSSCSSLQAGLGREPSSHSLKQLSSSPCSSPAPAWPQHTAEQRATAAAGAGASVSCSTTITKHRAGDTAKPGPLAPGMPPRYPESSLRKPNGHSSSTTTTSSRAAVPEAAGAAAASAGMANCSSGGGSSSGSGPGRILAAPVHAKDALPLRSLAPVANAVRRRTEGDRRLCRPGGSGSRQQASAAAIACSRQSAPALGLPEARGRSEAVDLSLAEMISGSTQAGQQQQQQEHSSSCWPAPQPEGSGYGDLAGRAAEDVEASATLLHGRQLRSSGGAWLPVARGTLVRGKGRFKRLTPAQLASFRLSSAMESASIGKLPSFSAAAASSGAPAHVRRSLLQASTGASSVWWSQQLPPRGRLLRALRRVLLPVAAAAAVAYSGLNRLEPCRRQFVSLGCAADLVPGQAQGPGATAASAAAAASMRGMQGRTVACVSDKPYQAIPAATDIIDATAAARDGRTGG